LSALSSDAHAALLRAHETPLSYGVRALVGPAPRSRLVIALGEAHLKLGPASSLGQDVVEQIALRGVETFQSKRVFAGRLLRWLIHVPRLLLRLVTMGTVKDSTITDAKQASHGHTVELERTKSVPLSLHFASVYLTALFTVLFAQMLLAVLAFFVPPLHVVLAAVAAVGTVLEVHLLLLIPAYLARKYWWCWLIHPLIAIVSARDRLMADGTVRMLADYPDQGPALVIMGRAHLPGYERELVERHGFRRISFPPKA
jgi:hypothetical protein